MPMIELTLCDLFNQNDLQQCINIFVNLRYFMISQPIKNMLNMTFTHKAVLQKNKKKEPSEETKCNILTF